MNKTIFFVLVGLILFVPGVTQAAFNFGSVSGNQIYLEQEQNAIVVKQIRTSAVWDINPPVGVTCESEAQQAGLSDSTNYWCLQKAGIGNIGYGTCVFLCQVGEGSGTLPSGPTPGSMTTYILSSAPVGHPLSYFNNSMYDSIMCLALPSLGYGCELKKHTPVNVAPAVSMTANPTSILSGSSSALTWSSTGATSCSLNQSIGGVATSGTRAVSPTSTTVYTVTCTGAGGSANASATVTVTSRPTASLSANPTSVTSGSASTLSWSSANALLCSGTGFDTQGATAGSVSTGALSATTAFSILCTGAAGSAVPGTWQLNYRDISDLACPVTSSNNVYSGVANCPSSPLGKSCSGVGDGNVCKVNTINNGVGSGSGCFVYTDVFTCSGGTGATASPTASASATVTVTNAPPTATLSASPTSIVSGSASTLTWSSTGATSCSLNQGIGGVATSGTRSVSPTATTPYTITCTGAGGSASDSKTVTVTPAPVTQSDLTTGGVAPTSATRNQAVTLSATISNIGAGAAGASTASLWIRNTAGTDIYSANISTAGVAAGGSTSVSSSYTFTTQGTYSARVCADTNTSWTGTLTESDENNNCGAWTAITVTNAPQPDLTAGGVSPTSATQGTSVTLSSTIQNLGATATGGSFTNLFQIDSDGDHNSIVTTRTDSSPNLSPAGSDGSQVSYTFGSEGTWYVRACADNDAAWLGSITEADENNNCGAWTAITVTDPTPPGPSASVSCSVSSTSVVPGGSATYSANPANGATGPYTWVASDGASVGTGSTASRTYATAGTYAMNVRASNSAVSYCPNVTVAANWCTAGSATLSITASPARVRSGQVSTVTWSASNVIGQDAVCTVSGPGVSWSSSVSASPSCSANGSATPTIATQSTYVLTCGGATKSVIVNVIPEFEEF